MIILEEGLFEAGWVDDACFEIAVRWMGVGRCVYGISD
jgi:hypothetical protein